MYIPFEEISDNSKCWVYILDNSIENFTKNINSLLIEICDNWKSHNLNIRSSYKIYKNRYIILFAEDSISGCSIDSSNRILRNKLNECNINIMPNSKIGIFNESKIQFEDKPSIIEKIKKGEVKPDNKMINTTIQNKDEYNKIWVLQINKSWLANFIK